MMLFLVQVLNEKMQDTPLKFIKFTIGTLSLRVLNLRSGSVVVSIRDVKIDLELQDQTYFNGKILYPCHHKRLYFVNAH